MMRVAPPARPAPAGEVRELGAAGLALARRFEARVESQRRGRGQRFEGVRGHVSAGWRNSAKNRETPPREHTRRAQSAGKCLPLWATPPPSVDAPFVELHERHSTAVLPMSNGAPAAASGTT